ncbi:MAG: hypothetical protein FDZ69_00180 [Deltaproteobacteria bacterium]|nr:MAG: hypothetical protein FDZ69_00180 [Deltaproteobacteria bacterium]
MKADKGKGGAKELKLVPQRDDLKGFINKDESFQTAYLRALAAIAMSDGTVSLAEYEELNQIVSRCELPALAASCTLNFLSLKASSSDAFSKLSKASAQINDDGIRYAAFEAARPLLSLQGSKIKELAKEFARALAIELTPLELDKIENGATATDWTNVVQRSPRLLLGMKALSVADECVRLTGNAEVARNVADYLDGKIEQHTLYTCVAQANADLARKLEDFEQRLVDTDTIEMVAQNYVQTADHLFEQVRQRLALVAARIDHEKRMFDDDFEDVIYDAGNAFELEAADRFRTDKWKSPKVWESLAKSTFGKELERRVDRIIRHHEKQLQLMKEDLRLFQEDMRVVNASILARQHHTQFARLMPSLRIKTRIVNAAEDAANLTLVSSAALAAGVGTAVYYLGAAAVMPVVAPIVPYVGGAAIVAALIKWVTDSEARKWDEIRDKRKKFEKIMREKLDEARSSYFTQLDELGREFLFTANVMMKPVMLEADAARLLAGAQKKVARRVLSDARQSLANLTSSIARLSVEKT